MDLKLSKLKLRDDGADEGAEPDAGILLLVFLGGLLGGACGAWYASIVGLGATGTGVTGIIGILLHQHMPLQYIIMMAISFGVSFAVTWVIWSPEEVKA